MTDIASTFNGISVALQKMSKGSPETVMPYGISDLIPKSWDGSNDKGQFRNFMAELRLWMQAWSDEGERLLTRIESADKGTAQQKKSEHSSPRCTKSCARQQRTDR